MNRGRLKVCYICEARARVPQFEGGDQQVNVDYKNDRLLRRFVTERGKIVPRRMTGTCAKCQRAVVRAIKRARYLALMPYVNDSIR